ncbi:MAG: alpha-ketoglutarate-dependent dioxygenase AlkB, partial [Alphaproteobacteria bacterium]|nr:alpha-ketoglutarate-dependent dioxygenase AlkB [Alphaproteobacteria bacterium]
MQSLFDTCGEREALGPGATLLRGYALSMAATLLAEIEQIVTRAPFR